MDERKKLELELDIEWKEVEHKMVLNYLHGKELIGSLCNGSVYLNHDDNRLYCTACHYTSHNTE